jgi:hypothetical protein
MRSPLRNDEVATMSNRQFPVGVAVLTVILGLAVTLAGAQVCPGDCNGDGEVTVDEIVLLTSVSVGTASAEACQAGNLNGDDAITIDEIIAAVDKALNGCPATPTATATGEGTSSPTAAPTDSPTPADTATPSPSLSATATATPSGPPGTPTRTATSTRSATPSRSATPTATGTRTRTPSVTPTPTHTATAPPTGTPSATVTATWTATATPDPNAPFVAVLSASCAAVSIGSTVAGNTTYTFRVENVPLGGFVGVSENRTYYACSSDQYNASCREGSPCVECDGWTGLSADWFGGCPLGHNVRRPGNPASTTCTATIPGERVSSSGQPTFAAYAYSGRYTDAIPGRLPGDGRTVRSRAYVSALAHRSDPIRHPHAEPLDPDPDNGCSHSLDGVRTT